MPGQLTRRQFARCGVAATAAVLSRASTSAVQPGASSRPRQGIVSVTRGPADVKRPPQVPPGKTWRYGLVLPFQLAAGKAAAFVNLRIRNGVLAPEPVADKLFGDYEVGVDIIPFQSTAEMRAEDAVVMSRNHAAANPNSDPPGQQVLMVTYPARGGFVPWGARQANGMPHPHAGTGFGILLAEARELRNAEKLEGGRRIHDDEAFRYFELHQLAYDGRSLSLTASRPVGVSELMAGWRITNGGMTNAIPDGEDLLVGMVGQSLNSAGPAGAGVMRWVCESGRWRAAQFTVVAGSSSEPSLIRDTDGSLLFSARGSGVASPAKNHDIRIWRSADKGVTWTKIIHVRGAIAGGPVTLNQAADGTPYIAANIYEVPLFAIPERYRLPRDADGSIRGGGWPREKLYLWPVHADRTKLAAPILARDPRAEFGGPPGGSIWRADHPSAMTLQLADGQWHNILGYRVLEDVEWHDQPPPPQTGAYLEEVVSTGEPLPVWRF